LPQATWSTRLLFEFLRIKWSPLLAKPLPMVTFDKEITIAEGFIPVKVLSAGTITP
jgi:hypothetical protein